MKPEEVREFRLQRSWTLKKFGEMVGYSEANISLIENGKRNVPERLRKIITLMNEVEEMKKGPIKTP